MIVQEVMHNLILTALLHKFLKLKIRIKAKIMRKKMEKKNYIKKCSPKHQYERITSVTTNYLKFT